MLGFARVPGRPDWPGKVISESGSRLKFAFFGTLKIFLIQKKDFFPFTEKHLKKVSTRQNLKRGAFKAGVAELKKEIESGEKDTIDAGKDAKKHDNPNQNKGLRKQKEENERLFKNTMVRSYARRIWTCKRCRTTTGFRYEIVNTNTNTNTKYSTNTVQIQLEYKYKYKYLLQVQGCQACRHLQQHGKTQAPQDQSHPLSPLPPPEAFYLQEGVEHPRQ